MYENQLALEGALRKTIESRRRPFSAQESS
jgi:hypothetical protein